MKILYYFFVLFILSTEVSALKLTKYNINMNYPWGMTWIDSEKLLITQKKSYKIILIDTVKNTYTNIEHNIPIEGLKQGGLLDIISEGNNVWITCSIKKNFGFTTAVFKSQLKNNKLINSELIFEALPYINNGKHFGSRMAIKGDHLFVSIGERGKGMIAQDPSNSIGSIIRIKKDGSIPNDNPYVNSLNWLPAVYQIGVRNPQGMDLDPLTNKVFISNHGPKGGDFIGEVKSGTNYGWKHVAWGGKNYSGTKVGEGNAWEPGFLKPNYIWVPSIGVGGIKFYQGDAFPKWKNSLLIGSLKFQYLSILKREDGIFKKEEIIFKNKIGRIRDIEVNSKGEIFLIADEQNTTLFKLSP